MAVRKQREYVHGYTAKEQNRLFQQAKFLEHYVHDSFDFSKISHLLEVGSGVGAQTAILLERYKNLKITCVEISEKQIAVAKDHLKKHIKSGRVKIVQTDAKKLPFKENTFDAAFTCWFLEHVPQPVEVLKEVKRVINSGAFVYSNEVLNSSFFLDPYSPATLQFLFAMNDHQWMTGGDPFVGAKLGNLYFEAGLQNVETNVVNIHFDNRAPKMRAQMIQYWTELLLSSGPALIKAKKIKPTLLTAMKKELHELKTKKDAVFFDAWIQTRGQAF